MTEIADECGDPNYQKRNGSEGVQVS